MASLFTKIINQEIPSYKIYEDDYVYSFLDIRPIQPGHTLLVPKEEVDYFVDLNSKTYLHLMAKSQDISRAIRKATQCKRVGLIVAGYEVPHFHLHMIPTFSLADFDFSKGHSIEDDQMKQIQKQILLYLNS
ncbi:MAG: HIT family protein [Bdellovibrionales bacterium]|nr:HIT family protein [Bdellovibrionales bacterium]